MENKEIPKNSFCKNTHYLHDITIFIDYNTGNIKNIIFNGIHMTHITNLDYYTYEPMKCLIKVDKIVTIIEKCWRTSFLRSKKKSTKYFALRIVVIKAKGPE
ncbi:hypothetical protein V1478_015372, partial [Vespula squamosa]